MIKLGVLPLLLMPLWAMAFSPKSIPSEINPPMSANNNQQWLTSKTPEFMTMRDMTFSTPSNVSIQNIDAGSITVTGIYIFMLSGSANDCSAAFYESEGNPWGALWSPQVPVAPNQIKSIGANYLYNMMMVSLYDKHVDTPSTPIYTPGNAEGGISQWCLWLGITNQAVTDGITCSTCALNPSNILVQAITGNPPISFTNITCDDTTRLCSTTDTIQPQPFPHQRP